MFAEKTTNKIIRHKVAEELTNFAASINRQFFWNKTLITRTQDKNRIPEKMTKLVQTEEKKTHSMLNFVNK